MVSISVCCVAFHCEPMPQTDSLSEMKFLNSSISVCTLVDSWDTDIILLEKCQKQNKKDKGRASHDRHLLRVKSEC